MKLMYRSKVAHVTPAAGKQLRMNVYAVNAIQQKSCGSTKALCILCWCTAHHSEVIEEVAP